MRLNFSQTNIFTAKPMVVGCVQHYSTHFRNKFKISLEPFFINQKIMILAKSAIFTNKMATLRSSPYGCLTSCQVREKSLERFLRKAVAHARTHTDGQEQFYRSCRFTAGAQKYCKNILLLLLKSAFFKQHFSQT